MPNAVLDHLVAIIVVLLVAVILAGQSFFILETGGRAVVVRLAVVQRWVKPGLSFIVPMLDRIVRLDARRYAPEYPAGKDGRVVTPLSPWGYVRLEGERWVWPATSVNGAAAKDTTVRVQKFENEKLFCKRRT